MDVTIIEVVAEDEVQDIVNPGICLLTEAILQPCGSRSLAPRRRRRYINYETNVTKQKSGRQRPLLVKMKQSVKEKTTAPETRVMRQMQGLVL